MKFSTLLTMMTDLVFPRRCPVCDGIVRPFGALICPECERKLLPITGPTCCKCGKGVADGQEYCYDCRRIRHRYKRGCSTFHYRSVSGSIFRMKYQGRAEYAAYYGEQMARRMRSEFDLSQIDVLIPVPLSEERSMKRGYNQAALLAGAISEQLQIPVLCDTLSRSKNTPVMRKMNVSTRRRNLENAFIVNRNDVLSKMIMLVDDIYTTGATIDACAGALLDAGAAAVYCVTLAIGDGVSETYNDQ